MIDQPITLGKDTAASNPARVRVNWFRYAWFYPKWPLIWALFLAGSLILAFKMSLWWLSLLTPVLALNFWYWIRVKEFFSHGDSNPGIVVGVNPTLVAVATDLTHGVRSYPAVKVIHTRLRRFMGEPAQVGTRLPTVAVYFRSPDQNLRHWADFDPRPLETATGNLQVLARVLAAYSEGEWMRLENCIRQLPHLQPGLHQLPKWPESTVPADEIPLEQFWAVIERTRAASKDEQLALLKAELQQLSNQELVGFQKRFAELKLASYSWDLWLVAWLCKGGLCSDDGFDYFRSWLISRGRAVYELAIQEPDALVEEISAVDDPDFEMFGYVAKEVYGERLGRQGPDLGLRHPKEPSGGDWLRPELKDRTGSKLLNLCVVFNEMGYEEYAAIESRFPRVWGYCIQKGYIKVGEPNAAEQSVAERIPTPEEIAKSKVDPNLANTDFPAYLKALADAAREEYDRRRTQN